MSLEFSIHRMITAQEFIDVLRRSGLSARRPVANVECMQKMVDNAGLICTAWDESALVGVARSVTDFAFCCYLSDLAVDRSYQKMGIGRKLIELTRSCLPAEAKVILLAAPEAREYYVRIGMSPHPSAWILKSTDTLL